MTCPNCSPRSPSTYNLSCIDCGVRLVLSARGPGDQKLVRRIQDQQLAAIEHCGGAAVKQQVIERLKASA